MYKQVVFIGTLCAILFHTWLFFFRLRFAQSAFIFAGWVFAFETHSCCIILFAPFYVKEIALISNTG